MRHLPLEDVIASLAAHTNDAIVITKAEPVRQNGPIILWVNNGFTAMTGYRADEVIGKTPRILQRDDTDPKARDRIFSGLKYWKPVRETLKNYRKDGTPFWVELNIKPVADEAGWYHYWVAVQRDVTSQVVQTRALETALEEAKAATKAQVAFLSAMSHELRTPLNGMLGMAQIVPRLGEVNEAQQNALDTIIDNGHALVGLMENIFDLVEIQSGKEGIQITEIDIRQLVDDAIETVRDVAEAKGIEIFRSYSVRLGSVLRSDPARLKKVLINLIGNSVKFTNKGEVVIKVRESAPELWEFSVQDTGLGISQDVVQKVFDPFFQASSGTTRSHGGAGLGLAVARRFIELLGGHITVETKLGTGSKFVLHIPSNAGAAKAVEFARSESAVSGKGGKILIVEDNALDRAIVEQVFRLNGWNPIALTEWGDFLAELEKHRPDLVVLDRQLGTTTGDELLRMIRARPDQLSQVPVIMLTADVSGSARERALSMGASQFFSKPVDIDSLVRCANDLRSSYLSRLA